MKGSDIIITIQLIGALLSYWKIISTAVLHSLVEGISMGHLMIA